MSDLAKSIARPEAPPGSPPVWLKPFEAGDRSAVFALLSDIPLLYPQGGEWLHRRLLDVASGKARCTLAMSRWNPVGATIESPKDRRRLKLSTVYVHPSFRQRGVGSRLIAAACRQWQRDELDEVYLTADIRRAPEVDLLLWKFGFRLTAIEAQRYGWSRDEVVFACRPGEQAGPDFGTSELRERALCRAKAV